MGFVALSGVAANISDLIEMLVFLIILNIAYLALMS